jgi:hypothetical protein
MASKDSKYYEASERLTGLDWLTITGNDPNGQVEVLADVVAWMDDLESKFEKVYNWRFQGYIGQAVGPLKVGIRADDEFVVIVSSEAANEIQERLPSLLTGNITRCDIQTTVTLKRSQDLAKMYYNRLTDENKSKQMRAEIDGKAPQLKKIKYLANNDGSTLYVNNRRGAIMLRLYDKGFELGQKRGLYWRFEIEYKRNHANIVFQNWLNSPNRTEYLLSVIAGEYTKRSIPVWFGSQATMSITVPEVVTDYQTKLDWLGRAVKPVVSKLVNAGYEEPVYSQLGLPFPDEW